MHRPFLLLALLLSLSGCAVQRTPSTPDSGVEFGRTPSWTLQARLHSALYRCELLVLNGNNARLAGEWARLPGFSQQLSDCQVAASTVANEATSQLPAGQDRELRNAQKRYLAAWQTYLGSLALTHPADLQLKQAYRVARSELLAVTHNEAKPSP